MLDLDALKQRMEASLNAAHKDFSGLRTGRASTNMVEGVVVEVYGSPMPLNQVATISVPEPRMIALSVWDKGNVPAVEKAIINADLGLNPSSDGTLVRLPVPDLTEERRTEMTKIGAQYAEKARIAVRNIRRDGMDEIKKLEKSKDISEDDARVLQDDVQALTDEYVKKIDEAYEHKSQEIMKV